MTKIVHLADIHIVNNPHEHFKYREQFKKLYDELDKIKPTKIVLVGDTLDNFIEISLEAELLTSEFLNKLSTYCEVIVVLGNHEIRKKDLSRKSSIGSIIKMINNKNITFFEKSGFYDDSTEDIVWVNYSHLEKTIIPWKDIKHNKTNKTYIGLYHDPIYGCKLPSGLSMNKKKLPKFEDFSNNDLNLFGDIHLRQFFDDKCAFCGSFMQLNFGEKVENHGFLLWEIDNGEISVKEYNLENEYNFINLCVGSGVNYDNLNILTKHAKKHSKFKVHWKELSSQINLENEVKIRNYIGSKYNIDPNKIKIDKEFLYTSIIESQMLSESVDITDKTIQHEIFNEYLENKGYSEEQIKQILEIDDIVDERLELKPILNNINYSLDELWIDNFKSYGLKNNLPWKDSNGVIQITGENQQGKTTIIDAITYLFFGTTMATNILGGGKKEKFGDQRYINNKNKHDYCKVDGKITIDGETLTLKRRTDRQWTKNNTVKACPTIFTILNDQGLPLNEETRAKTQRKLDSILGTFDDFVRMILTNADNLNALLSLNRSIFIDSLIKDAGYDVFDKKLKEFKSYKKEEEESEETININIIDVESDIKESEEEISDYEDLNTTNLDKIEIIDIKLKTSFNERDEEIKKLHKIDAEIVELDIDELNQRLEQYKEAIITNQNKQTKNSEYMKNLKQEFDEDKLKSLYKEVQNIDKSVMDIQLSIKDTDNKISKENQVIDKVDDKIDNMKDKEIDRKRSLIDDINDKINNLDSLYQKAVDDKVKDVEKEVNSINSEIKLTKSELKHIRETGIGKKKEISKLEKEIEDLEDSKVCPTCNREWDDEDKQKHIRNWVDKYRDNIKILDQEIQGLFDKVKPEQSKLMTLKSLMLEKEEKVFDLKNDIISGFSDLEILKEDHLKKKEELVDNITSIEVIINEIKDGDYKNVKILEENILKGLTVKENSLKQIRIFQLENKEKVQLIKDKKSEIETVEMDINLLEKEQEQVKKWQVLFNDNEKLKLEIDKYRLTIEKFNEKFKRYNEHLNYIEDNKKIELLISDIEFSISDNEDRKKLLTDKISNNSIEINIYKKEIEKNLKKIEIFKEQERRKSLWKEYETLVHRDGLPSYLLKKSIHLINHKLSEMLGGVDFDVYFNEDLNLRMFMKSSPDVEQNAIESSGKERVFIAVALKSALRHINNRSKINMLLLDEIMGKLLNKSVDEFRNLLLNLKNDIDKIVIIEHIHPIQPDYIIDVIKNEDGISSFNLS